MNKEFNTLEKFRRNTVIRRFKVADLPKLLKIKRNRLKEFSTFNPINNIKLKSKKKVSLFNKRRSTRKFKKSYVTLEELSEILLNSVGMRKESLTQEYSLPKRKYPTAGGLNSIEIVVYIQRVKGVEKGYYLFDPYNEKLKKINISLEISKILAYNDNIKTENSSFSILLFSNLEAGLIKYGVRAYRYSLIEAGHIAQNILLCATLFNMGGICIGAYREYKIKIFKEWNLEYAVMMGKNDK